MKRWIGVVLAAVLVGGAAGDPLPVTVLLDRVAYKGQSTVFRADVTSLDLSGGGEFGTIQGVVIKDRNLQKGSSGVFSGFDLDFVVFDRDGDVTTTSDQIRPLLCPATVLKTGGVRKEATSLYQPTDGRLGKLFGLRNDEAMSIDHAVATLGIRDAYYDLGVDNLTVSDSGGWLSLGDGGYVTVRFPPITRPDSSQGSLGGAQDKLYLLIGEVGIDTKTDELSDADASIELFGVGGPHRVLVPVPLPDPSKRPVLSPGKCADFDPRPVPPQQEGAIYKWSIEVRDIHDPTRVGATYPGIGDGQVLAVSYDYLTGILGLPEECIAKFTYYTADATGKQITGLSDSAEVILPDPATWLLLVPAATILLRRRNRPRANAARPA